MMLFLILCNNNNPFTLFWTLRTSQRIVFTVKSTDNFNFIILISRLYQATVKTPIRVCFQVTVYPVRSLLTCPAVISRYSNLFIIIAPLTLTVVPFQSRLNHFSYKCTHYLRFLTIDYTYLNEYHQFVYSMSTIKSIFYSPTPLTCMYREEVT